MWELDHKEGWESNNWCFQIVVLEKTLESPLKSKNIKPINPEGNQPWIFIGRTEAEIEAPILWPPDVKRWLIGKDSDAGKNWRQRRKWQLGIRWLERVTDSMDMNLSKLCELVEYRGTWCTTFHEVEKSWIRLSNWMTKGSTHDRQYNLPQLWAQSYNVL